MHQKIAQFGHTKNSGSKLVEGSAHIFIIILVCNTKIVAMSRSPLMEPAKGKENCSASSSEMVSREHLLKNGDIAALRRLQTCQQNCPNHAGLGIDLIQRLGYGEVEGVNTTISHWSVSMRRMKSAIELTLDSSS